MKGDQLPDERRGAERAEIRRAKAKIYKNIDERSHSEAEKLCGSPRPQRLCVRPVARINFRRDSRPKPTPNPSKEGSGRAEHPGEVPLLGGVRGGFVPENDSGNRSRLQCSTTEWLAKPPPSFLRQHLAIGLVNLSGQGRLRDRFSIEARDADHAQRAL